MESEAYFCRETSKIYSDKVLKENYTAGKTWISAKLYDTATADSNVSLTVYETSTEINMCYACAHFLVLWKEEI